MLFTFMYSALAKHFPFLNVLVGSCYYQVFRAVPTKFAFV